MAEQELREKIVEVLTEAMKPIEYGGDSEHAPEFHYPTEEELANSLIEAGIGDISEYKHRADEIKRLEAENAALRERLDKAVELPCRVGDKVYCIHGMSNPEMLEWQVNEIRITDHNYMLQLGRAGTKDYRNEASQFYGKWWFVTREAAEACLKELKENNND